MDENKKLKIWLIVLSCLLVLLGAYVFYLEYNRGNSDSKINETDVKENGDQTINGDVIEKLSYDEVYNLVSKYTNLGSTYNLDDYVKSLKYYFNNNLKDLDFEKIKLFVALKNSIGSNITDCKKAGNNILEFDGQDYGLLEYGVFCFDNGASKSYSYVDVNKQYKVLFGTDKDAIQESIYIADYYYFDGDNFVSLFEHDNGLSPDGHVSKITNFTQIDNELMVTVSYLYDTKFEDYSLFGLSLKETDAYINKMFSERNDYSYQYNLKFEYENDHFVLRDITEI